MTNVDEKEKFTPPPQGEMSGGQFTPLPQGEMNGGQFTPPPQGEMNGGQFTPPPQGEMNVCESQCISGQVGADERAGYHIFDSMCSVSVQELV